MINILTVKTDSKGQVLVILLLVMLFALSIGLAITQRATTDLATSSQTEQSSRAITAAEAGLEKALASPTTITSLNVPLGNQTSAEIINSGVLPIPGSQLAIEYPPVGKETIAQFWLFDSANPSNNYNQSRFAIYFGYPELGGYSYTASNIKPAVEVNVVVLTGGVYQNYRYYYDSVAYRGNNFALSSCGSTAQIPTILASQSQFLCSQTVDLSQTPFNCSLPSCVPQVVRVRLLYSTGHQKIALAPLGNGSFPPQIELFTSTGKSGQSQKTLQVFRVKDMLPTWMDFAIFSVNNISKQ